jgi:hypothetical protein
MGSGPVVKGAGHCHMIQPLLGAAGLNSAAVIRNQSSKQKSLAADNADERG